MKSNYFKIYSHFIQRKVDTPGGKDKDLWVDPSPCLQVLSLLASWMNIKAQTFISKLDMTTLQEKVSQEQAHDSEAHLFSQSGVPQEC